MNRLSILGRLYIALALWSAWLLPVEGNSVFLKTELQLLVQDSILPKNGLQLLVENSPKMQEDGGWLNEIVEGLFLNNTMIYTLFGTKPMSGSTRCIATEKEYIRSCQPFFMLVTDEVRNKLLNSLREGYENDHFLENYQKWLEYRKTHPSSRFLFRASINEHYLDLYMINVQEVVWTLQKYNSLFSKETGLAFDPLKVVWEYENPDSEFWKRVLSNGYLTGILYGFGEKNAYLFSLWCSTENKAAFDTRLGPRRITKDSSEEFTIADIDIPPFRSFGSPFVDDPVVAQFEEERLTIQNRLQGKNFVEEALKRLFENP